jgi:polyhydroxybutyrate depolymerase
MLARTCSWFGIACASLILVGCSGDPAPPADSATSSESGDGDGDSGDGDGDSGDGDGDGDSGDGDGDGDSGDGDGDAGDGDGDGEGGLFPGCGNASPGPGTHTGLTVDVDGVTREYELFVPVTYNPDLPSALVVNFHGLFGWPSQQADFSQFNMSAQLRGMLVAYPVGIGNSFNAGLCCGDAQSSGADDEGFARALVAELIDEHCIDPKWVYATGMSNGGHMAHMLACNTADVFAATASVAGVLSFNPFECQPSRPISIIDFHGTADLIVPYDSVPEVGQMMQDWAARNGCSPTSEVTFAQGDTTCETWPGCDDGVEVSLCTIEGGGHCWPGNASCLFGASTTELHASEVIADMFLEQTLP